MHVAMLLTVFSTVGSATRQVASCCTSHMYTLLLAEHWLSAALQSCVHAALDILDIYHNQRLTLTARPRMTIALPPQPPRALPSLPSATPPASCLTTAT
jgi:hypothetical protein